jgi:hypothetical protein
MAAGIPLDTTLIVHRRAVRDQLARADRTVRSFSPMIFTSPRDGSGLSCCAGLRRSCGTPAQARHLPYIPIVGISPIVGMSTFFGSLKHRAIRSRAATRECHKAWTKERVNRRSTQPAAPAVSPPPSPQLCRWPHSGHTTPRKTDKRCKPTSDILAGQTACAQVARRRDTVYGSDDHTMCRFRPEAAD